MIEAVLRHEIVAAVSALSAANPAAFPPDVFSWDAFRWVRSSTRGSAAQAMPS